MEFVYNEDMWTIKEISNEEMNKICPPEGNDTYTYGVTLYSENVVYINETSPSKRKTIYHELMHVFMYEAGHNQWTKEFNNEDVCEISSHSHDFIENITNDYFKWKFKNEKEDK